jgi:hypothetical protein
MLSPTQILLGLLIPSALAAALAILGWLTTGKSHGATLGVAAALAFAYKPMTGQWPPFPPVSTTDWPLYFLFPLTLIALFEKKIPWPLRPLITLIASAALAWLTLKPLSPGPLAAAIVALAATISWTLIEPLTTRRPGVTAPILLWLLSTGSALLLLLGASPRLGFLAVTLAGIFGAYFLFSLLLKKNPISAGPALLCIPLLSAWLSYAYLDSSVITPLELTLLTAAPLLAWIPELPKISNLKSWKRELLRAALVAAPIAAAIVLAAIQFKKDSAGMEM